MDEAASGQAALVGDDFAVVGQAARRNDLDLGPQLGHVAHRAGDGFGQAGGCVWRGFNPRNKSEKPGPHNGWRNQDGTGK